VSKSIQIREVPDRLHRVLKKRAAKAGMSLSRYLLTEITEFAGQPTLAEFRELLHERKRVSIAINSARLIREQRGFR
jgi:plasmid stability protein